MYRLRLVEIRIIRRASISPWRWLLAGCALALLAACSSLKLAYDNTPTLAYWWLDRYVDFEDDQSVAVREALVRLQEWHRVAELPKLADLLANAQRQAEHDVTPEQLCRIYAEARLRFDAVVRHAEPTYVALAMQIKPQQIENIAARFEKTNREWRSDWIDVTADQRLERRLERSRERAEDFYGPLQSAQIELLRTALVRSDFDLQRSYRERLRRQQDLLQTLRTASMGGAGQAVTSERASAAVRAYVQRSMRSADGDERATEETAVAQGCHLIATLHNSTNAEQRKKAIRKMHIHERSLRELSKIR